jgi:nicotinate-nucleotide pyrophosphorylase (carboxylating)
MAASVSPVERTYLPRLARPLVRRAVELALMEDLADGDATTDLCVPPDVQVEGRFVARAPLVVCGLDLVEEVFQQVSADVAVSREVDEGAYVPARTHVATVRGDGRSVLTGERTALNFLQRLSGVATTVHSYVDALPAGSSTRITETRKTTPGLRAFERYAVRCGGGFSHRTNLGAAIMIKDNHIALAGGVKQAVSAARRGASHTMTVSCEVDRVDQIEEAIQAGADIIVLDNFKVAEIQEALDVIASRVPVEVTGGVDLSNVRDIGVMGVDAISIGALTQASAAIDIGLDFDA